ncbi:MAG: hypothetical protein QOD44_3043, partial [Solirubrobacteraceae bacterium]|nr:hypothetical protein [Solirubrobacteraceae bacterium]
MSTHKKGSAGRGAPWEPRTGKDAGDGGYRAGVTRGRSHEGVAALLGSRALRGAVLAGMAASAIAAVPASAGVGTQGIRPGHNITVFHNIDMVGVFGHPIGAQTLVEVYRGEHRIATARGPAISTPDGGALEVNHGPVGAPLPGDCWDGATPDIRPGDRIVVSNPGGPAGVDEAIVDDISITSRTTVTRDADTGGPVVVIPGVDAVPDDPATLDVDESQPAVPPSTEPTRQEVWVEGNAFFMDANGTRGPAIPVASLDSNSFIDLPADNKLRLSSNLVEEGSGGPGTYITRYFAPFRIDRNDSGRNDASIFNALATGRDGHAAGYGHVAVLPPVSMLVDGMDEQATAALGCEISPKEASSAGTIAGSLNAATMAAAGNSDDMLTIGGWAAETVTAADVVLSDGTNSVRSAVRLSNGPGQKGWTATFRKSDFDTLAQGTLTARLDVGAGPVGAARTVSFDTIAPSISVSLAEGTYTGTQALTATAGGDSLTYRLDGAAARPVVGQIQLTPGSHTLVLTATDAAGNTTTRTLPYTILAAAQQPTQQQGQQQGPPAAQPQGQAPAAPQAAPAVAAPAALIP